MPVLLQAGKDSAAALAAAESLPAWRSSGMAGLHVAADVIASKARSASPDALRLGVRSNQAGTCSRMNQSSAMYERRDSTALVLRVSTTRGISGFNSRSRSASIGRVSFQLTMKA